MRSLVLSVALAVSGCSFVLVDGPPAYAPTYRAITCDSSAVLPNVLDLVGGTLLGLVVFAIYYGASIDESRPSSEQPAPILPAVLGIATAAPFYASAYIGHRRAQRCDVMKRAMPR